MTIANTCVLIAAVLPVVTMGLAKAATAGFVFMFNFVSRRSLLFKTSAKSPGQRTV